MVSTAVSSAPFGSDSSYLRASTARVPPMLGNMSAPARARTIERPLRRDRMLGRCKQDGVQP